MKHLTEYALITWLLFTACVTAGSNARPSPTPEQMPEGRKVCAELCAEHKREFQEYRYNGDCICKPLRLIQPGVDT